jgi:hypothetical protein
MGDIQELAEKLHSSSEKQQLQLVSELKDKGEEGLNLLRNFLEQNCNASPNLVLGKIYQTLYQCKITSIQDFLNDKFPTGIVPLKSAKNIDYIPLEKALAQGDFQEADLITNQKLCELAGVMAIKRKWVYFTEADRFPDEDLLTIDQLWVNYSEGKFGFSIQRLIWLSLDKNFVKMWDKIGWRKDNSWTRYPKEFIWDLSAPKGHLPLSNQLRGSQVINSLLSHPVWSK